MGVLTGLLAVFGISLLPPFGAPFRADMSSLGLLVGALALIISGLARALRTPPGALRRPWLLLALAGLLPLIGNVWVVSSGADPVSDPSMLGEISIGLGLVVAIIGLLSFATERRRGVELAMLVLDGLVASAALLVVFSVLVYQELLTSSGGTFLRDRPFALVVPVLDILLASVALLLIVRSTGRQRLTCGLVAVGVLLYTIGDLSYTVRVARGTFEFGSPLDLTWIAGDLVIALAAWSPSDWAVLRRHEEPSSRLSDTFATTVIFAVLMIAALVQVVFGGTGRLVGAQATTWVLLILAVGARQIVLTADNSALRRGLERRVAEQTADLRRISRRSELLLESVGDGIYGVDRAGQITFVNVSAATMLGWDPLTLRGRLPRDVFHPLAEADRSRRPVTAAQQAIASAVSVTLSDETYRRANGAEFAVESTASPLIDDGEVTGAVIVFRDVTQRREVDRMKNEFLSVVSHELRTPLTSIRASLELIEGGHLGEVPPGADRMITVARESSERLSRLINDLLDIERIESGAAPLTIAVLDARGLLTTAGNQLSAMVATQGLDLEIARADGRVHADEDQIIQALTNLVGNACKFSEPGSMVTLEAVEDGPMIRFSVRDRGRGIPEDKLDHVFERFAQVDSSDSRQKGGTGLGLTITKGIVGRHGGQIWASSTVGVGTTVSFTLPAAARPLTDPQLSVDTAGSGATVLVCDDDAAVVESLSAVLSSRGYRPVGVTDGTLVLGLIASEDPQVILLDLLMPGTTGAEVLAAIQDDERARSIPVVVVSGLGPEANPPVAGATSGWLIKPVSETQLARTVAVTLSGRQHGGSVLLVEDDDVLAGGLVTMLSAEGLEVVRAATATEAVVRARELRPDVVILDLLLPDGHGSEVVAELRRGGSLATTPLIVYSGDVVDQGARRDLRLGATTFLEKGRTGPRELKDQVLELVRAATKSSGQHLLPGPSTGGEVNGGTSTPP